MKTLPVPIPIELPWTMKPLASAQTRLTYLEDGRLHLWIRHDVLHGVTPEMLVWWFQNLEGDMELEGRRLPRYRVWHPRDHVALRYARLPPGGKAGPGARFHIQEVLGGRPELTIDTLTDVTRLDTGGFAHRPRLLGLHVARMDYAFTRVPGGTLYENSLTFGFPSRAARALNAWLVRTHFTEARGHAWLLHNIEEVGNLEHFLPRLYAGGHGRASSRAA